MAYPLVLAAVVARPAWLLPAGPACGGAAMYAYAWQRAQLLVAARAQATRVSFDPSWN